MKCQKCGTRMKTRRTCQYDTRTIRYIKCPKCGFKTKTVEE